jgi:hypothetical protein
MDSAEPAFNVTEEKNYGTRCDYDLGPGATRFHDETGSKIRAAMDFPGYLMVLQVPLLALLNVNDI